MDSLTLSEVLNFEFAVVVAAVGVDVESASCPISTTAYSCGALSWVDKCWTCVVC